MRIAHISDLHFNTKLKRENIQKTKRLIRYALDCGAEHFVITGDISDNADEKDFKILRELLKNFNLLRSEKASIVIGNHDIFGGPQTVQEIVNFPRKCLAVNYHNKVTLFVQSFKELFQNTIRLHEESFFPYAKVLKNILFVGLNSIDEYSRIKNPFASNGHISKLQRHGIKALLSRNEFKEKIKIILTHHHFYPKNVASHSSERTMWNRIENHTMKLRGKKKLLKLFLENNVKLVSHGHSHEMKEYFREGIRFTNSGGSVDNHRKEEASMFIIDVFPFDISTTFHSLPSDVNLKKEKQELITSLV